MLPPESPRQSKLNQTPLHSALPRPVGGRSSNTPRPKYKFAPRAHRLWLSRDCIELYNVTAVVHSITLDGSLLCYSVILYLIINLYSAALHKSIINREEEGKTQILQVANKSLD